MSVLPVGFGSALGGYQIERSLRFNSADSAYLNRTPASAGNRKTWTFSCWVKKSTTGSVLELLSASPSGAGVDQFFFGSNDAINYFYNENGSVRFNVITASIYRDPSAWYHVVLAVDTTQATSTNRAKIYVNGTEASLAGGLTYAPQNTDTYINGANLTAIGSQISNGSNNGLYLNGYLTEVNFIDGQALTPSSFGETDTNTGVWKPKAYTGTYGTNGFELLFADNSGTTSTTLGKDSSGNGNNWTPINFSVTAGAGNDSLVDSPTSYGTDTGVGGEVRGNYATYNSAGSAPSVTLTNGNLDASHGAFSSTTGAASTFGVSSGKWYWEVTINAISSGAPYIGIVRSDQLYPFTTLFANNSQGYAYRSTGVKRNNGSDTSYGASYTSGDVIGVALDMDAGTIVFYKNNTSQGTAFSSLSGTFIPIDANGTSGGTYTSTINFGQRAFAYTAPSGFKALCTQNLPTPTIGATSTTQADNYFGINTYAGNAGTQSLTLDFEPDFAWFKNRLAANSHLLIDRLRGSGTGGASKILISHSTDAEQTVSTGGATFTSTGMTVTHDASWLSLNGGSTSIVAWAWKANGAGSTNTAGTITSTVSANTTSGFSIVTYTGNGTNGATFGHGLGVVPAMIIIKARNAVQGWLTYHRNMNATPQNGKLWLHLTNAYAADSSVWNNTAPTSTLITLGTGSECNGNTNTYVAYCFANVEGYSRAFSYTGNGSSDGPFVFLGFRPRFILTKRSDSADDWNIIDTARSTYNEADAVLFPNLSNAEYTTSDRSRDILSNGFKVRDTNAEVNASGGTYIGFAWAESPFKYSLGR